MDIKFINGSVTLPKGFKASGVCCGIKSTNKTKNDLGLIYCDVLCNSAAIFTQNAVKASPILVTKKHLENGYAQAIIANSGNANACNKDGIIKANKMCDLISEKLNIPSEDVIVASTGVIGQSLPIEPIENNIKSLVSKLSKDGSSEVASAILTTDTIKKEVAVKCEIDGKEVTIGGIAKGSGMIHINMATMLCFITTDAKISSEMLKEVLTDVADDTFNMISVDGDTSTNDTLAIMASGMACNKEIVEKDENYKIFANALKELLIKMCKLIAGDGEGATKLLVVDVKNAKTKKDAKMVAKSVVCSSLVKSAMFGADANWGRVLCAVGYSQADIDINKVDIDFTTVKGVIEVCKDGYGIEFSEYQAKEVLNQRNITINIDLKDGNKNATAYGCDLTYEYVRINGEYRT